MKATLTKLFLALTLIATISSCEKKSCAHVTCPTGLECASGSCICEDGYEGTNCETLSSQKYIGHTWLASNTCNDPNGGSSYDVFVSSCNNSSQVNCLIFDNLVDNQQVQALILNTSAGNLGNTIYIPAQNLGSISISQSTGTYYPANTTNSSNPSIIINMTYTNGNNAFNCPITLYQQ